MAIDASLIGDPESLKHRRITIKKPMTEVVEGEIFVADEDERGVHLRIKRPNSNRNTIEHLWWRKLVLVEKTPAGDITIGLGRDEIFTIHPPPPQQFV